MKSLLLLCLALFSSTITVSQSRVNVQGSVVGSSDYPLTNASVVLLSKADSSLVSFGLSDASGKFNIMDVAYGDYIIQVTFLGYDQYSDSLKVDTDTPEVLDPITLQRAAYALEEVQVKGQRVPMEVRKDTLIYNAAAFQAQPNEVVEDLLRRLPGVEVDSDGTITAQGEEVERVTVDGKRFFGDDPTIATKNLPADAIESVEIFDAKSDMAAFSGMDDGEREKTINLELKEDRKKGQFGTLEAGYGTDSRYKSRLSLNRFSSKTQISAIGNFNNINEQGFSSSDYANFMQGIGFRGRGNGLVNNGLSNGFVTTNAGGINLNHSFSSKTDLTVSYFLNDILNNISSDLARENFVERNSFFDNENNITTNTSSNHRLNAELEIDIDSTQDLTLRTSATLNDGNSTYKGLTERLNNDLVLQNSSQQNFQSDGNSLNMSGRMTYRKKIGNTKKKTLTLQANINDSDSDMEGLLESDNSFFNEDGTPSLIDNLVQLQSQSDEGTNYRLQSSFVTPLSPKTFLEFKYARQNYNNELRRIIEDIITGDPIVNDDLSNHYQRDYVYDRGSLVWHLNTDLTSLSIEGAVQNSKLEGDIISENLSIENEVFQILPRINFRHELGQSQNIRIQYSTSVNEPSLEQLQPIIDNSDPINLYQGNPNLVPEFSHNLRLNYVNFDQFSFRSFFAFINARYTRNNITNQTIIDEDFRQLTQPVNVDYDFNISANLNFSTPLKFLRTRLNIGTRLSYQNSLVFINAQENTRNRLTPSFNVKLENRDKTTIDWGLGGTYRFNTTTYSLSDRNQSFSTQTMYSNFTYNYKNTLSIGTSMNVNFYSEEQFGEALTVPIWKASMSKYFLKDQRLEMKLSVFDILNQNLGVSRINGLNFIENSEIISLGRYGMISVIYAIKGPGQNGGQNSGRRGGKRF